MLQKGEFSNVAYVVLPYYMKESGKKTSFLFLLSLF